MPMGLMTKAPAFEHYRLSGPFGAWPAGAILKVLNPESWPPVRTLGERLGDSVTANFEFDAAEHAKILAIENAPPREPPREPIRHDVLMARFGWTDLEYAAALRIGFPKPGDNGTGTSHDWRGYTLTAKWTTYTPDVINAWLASVQAFAATLPKEI
jgi:hypothetical protein